MLAGTARIAKDVVDEAILFFFDTTPEVEQGRIFEQEQIARAVSLGQGITHTEDVELLTGDDGSAAYTKQIQEVLLSV